MVALTTTPDVQPKFLNIGEKDEAGKFYLADRGPSDLLQWACEILRSGLRWEVLGNKTFMLVPQGATIFCLSVCFI